MDRHGVLDEELTMTRQERQGLERTRQFHIRRDNEAMEPYARVSCGAGCEECYAPDCPHSVRVQFDEAEEHE